MAAVLAVLASAAPNSSQANRNAVTMREKVYEKLGLAQEAAEVNDYAKAFDALRDVEKMKDLDPYEKAQLYTAFGYIYFTQEKYVESIGAYEKVLQQENLPEALQASTLYTLAQLRFQTEEYDKAVGHLERWLANATNPGPEVFVLLGQAYYQLQRFQAAIAPVERAMAIAKERGQPTQENWYLLLRVLYQELEDHPKLLEVVEILVTQFPRREYWMHLAATYGVMGDTARQLAAYEVAYDQGYLTAGSELVLLSQLLLQAEVPYRAGVVLAKGIEDGAVEPTAANYRLLSQAWILAREDARAIEALTEAAERSNIGELDARLAQAYANVDDWPKAIEAAESALRKGVEHAHELHVLIGTGWVELGRYEDAKAAFRSAQKSPVGRQMALQWLTYIEREEQRLRALQISLE